MTRRRNPFPVGLLSDRELVRLQSMQSRVPSIELDCFEASMEVTRLVARDLCEAHAVVPVSRAGGSLIVAMRDPKDEAALEELEGATGLTIEPVIATESAIRAAIGRYYGRS